MAKVYGKGFEKGPDISSWKSIQFFTIEIVEYDIIHLTTTFTVELRIPWQTARALAEEGWKDFVREGACKN